MTGPQQVRYSCNILWGHFQTFSEAVLDITKCDICFFLQKITHLWLAYTDKLQLNETQKQLREVNLSTIGGPVSRWGLVRIRGPASSWSSWGPVSVFFGRIFTTNTIFRVISLINTPHLRRLQENHTSQGFEVGRVRSEIKACFERAQPRISAMYGSCVFD